MAYELLNYFLKTESDNLLLEQTLRFVFIFILSVFWSLAASAQESESSGSNVIQFNQVAPELLLVRQLEPLLGLFYSNLTYGGNHGTVMSLWKLYITQTEQGRTLILDHWHDTGHGEANVRRLSEIPLSALTAAGAAGSETPYKMRILRDNERALHLGSSSREALILNIESHGKSYSFQHNSHLSPYLEMSHGFKFTMQDNPLVRSILVFQKTVSDQGKPSQVTAMEFISGEYEVQFDALAIPYGPDSRDRSSNQCRNLFAL